MVPYAPATFPMDYFDDCPGYARVTLSVDMSNEFVSGNGVCVAGGTMPNGPEGTEMCDLNGDDIYSTILSFPYGTNQTYKFVNGCGTTWENPGFEELPDECTEGEWNDRYFDVYEDNQVEGPYIFGECSTLSNSEDVYPFGYCLSEPYPNPFNPSTTILFSVPSFDHVSIRVYDLKGSLIETLSKDYYHPGNHRVDWNGDNHSSGLYIVRMESGNFKSSQIITLVK